MDKSDGGDDPKTHKFDEISPAAIDDSGRLSLEALKNVKLNISAELGSSPILVRDILELKKGSVVALDKAAGEMTDIYLNGLLLARGEVVVIGDTLHVRIAEIVGIAELQSEHQVET